MNKKDYPYVSRELVDTLRKNFPMPTYILDKDIRQIDFISGQQSMIEFLESINNKQKEGGN